MLGMGTWSRAWRLLEPDGRKLLNELQRRGLTRLFDLNGAIGYTKMLKNQIANKNNSWAIRWHAAMFLPTGCSCLPARAWLITSALTAPARIA